MSFKSPYLSAKNNFQNYLLALIFIVAAYIVGNLPSLFVFSQNQTNSNDIVEVLQHQVGSTNTFTLLLFPWICVFFIVLIVAKYILNWPIVFLFTNRLKFDYKRLLFGFLIWFIISLLVFFISKNEFVLSNFKPEKFFPLLVVAFIVLLIQCAAEELVFRSFLLKWLGTKISSGLILSIITGAIFGYLHASNPEVETLGKIALVYYIGTGIFLGLLTIIDDGLELSIGFHFANNLFAALVVTSNWQVFQTDALFLDTNPPSFTGVDFLLAFGGQLFFFLICWFVFKWNLKKII